jgi:hypothetical protein
MPRTGVSCSVQRRRGCRGMPRTGVSHASSRIPRSDVSCLAQTIPAPERRGQAFQNERRGQAFQNAEDRNDPGPRTPRTGVSCPSAKVPEDARGQAFHARLERSRPRADLSFARPPLAGRPRLLGAAAHSGQCGDRTAGGARDECLRSCQGAELARRRSHRMQQPTIGR